MDIHKPIFIIGAGRCGSTLFHHLLANHPKLCWLSRLAATRPHQPQWNARVMSALDWPLLGNLVKARIKPTEAYPFWNHFYGGFGRPCRDLEAGDLSTRAKDKLTATMSNYLTRKRDRLLIKLTGWSRMGFIEALFPDVRFIHVVRDWRAVANSTMNVYFWRGWKGPSNWRWGPLTPERNELWERHDRSFVALAGIQMTILLEALEQARARLRTGRFLEIKYEDLCTRPLEVFEEVCAFCELDVTPAFTRVLERKRFLDANHKWRRDLTQAQQQILETVLADPLKRYGYL